MKALPTAAMLAAVVVVLALPCAGQMKSVVPGIYQDLEAYGSFKYPFSYTDARLQEILLATEIAPTGARINIISFRRNGTDTSTYSSKTLNLVMDLCETSLSPNNMTKTWVTNQGGGTPVTVFSGQLSLPGTAAPASLPAPFNLSIPLTSPYTYTVANGNLLIDMVVSQGTTTTWSLDCNRQSATSGGEEGYVGLGCTGGNGNTIAFGIDEHALMTGGQLDAAFKCTNLTSALAWLGFSHTNIGGLPLPMDLTPLGAPGCLLHTDIRSTIPIPATGGNAIWNIPNDPLLVEAVVYLQGAGVDLTANPMGLILSEARFARIGSQTNQGYVECVFSKTTGSTTGYQAGSTLNTAPVVEIDGLIY